MKRCSCCKQTKIACLFSKDYRRKDGHSSHCLSCHNKASVKWNHTHLEQRNFNSRRWRKNNLEYCRAYHRKWKKAHPEQVKKSLQLWRKHNPEKYKLGCKRWRKQHPDKQREIMRRQAFRDRLKLSPYYVRRLISKRTNLSATQIPDALVKLQTQIIKLKRLCKNLKT